MSSETTTCSGCDGTFSLRGYHSHLAQTRDPLCRAIFNKLKKANDAYELLMNTGDDSTEVEAGLFQGDAFGTAEDYATDMFGQLGDDHDENMDTRDSGPDDGPPAPSELSDDEDDDEDEAHMVAELEKSWEPHREGAPGLEVEDDLGNGGPGDVEVEPGLGEEEDNSDGEGDRRRNIGRFIIGDGYGVKPTVRVRYTDKYPNARAGQPLSREETRDSGYASALGGGDNPWAPFNSKKDWEIARWAKLRGMGSTSFSELLAIDGVCFN